MKIAFFVWEFFPRMVGGLGSYAIEITKKFKELKNDITVFTLNDGHLSTRENWNGIDVHRPLILDTSDIFPFFITDDLKKWGQNVKLFSDIFNYNILSASKLVNQLLRKKSKKFDMLAVHDWMSSISGLSIKKEIKDFPVVFHIHSIEEQRALGGGSQVIKDLERKMANKADRIITVSNSMKDYLVSVGYPKNKITVCYNGCNPEKYDPSKVNKKKLEELKEKYKIKPKENVMLFVGRLTRVKGVHNLIHSIPMVLKEFPNTKLIILGKGEEYKKLITLAQKLNVLKKINIRSEWVSEEERILHYALADVCIFPSINEPFGIVSLEAMAMENPVVVGAAGVVNGLKEQVIPHGKKKTGIHVNGESPENIGWGIKEVLKNLDEAKEWGKNGRKRVLKAFTWDKAAKKTLSIYKELIK